MSLIYFYDSTELDKQQISEALEESDHNWKFIEEKISPENCDPEAEVISVFVSSTVTREVIEAMPKLKLIACRSTGFNNIDFDAAKERGVTITNVPTYGEDTVAEYAFTLLLALIRRLPEVLETENRQFVSEYLRGNDLSGKVFGVVGAGHIGINSLKIANGFSMETLAYDAFPRPEMEDRYGFKYVELDELLAKSDFVSLHAPLLPATRHIINEERLGKMKDGAILINTARGELVKTRALVEALESGKLGGAAIDVIEGEVMLHHREEQALLRNETLPEHFLRHSVEISLLKKMPNVIISPHNAFNTVEAINRINQTTVDNIISFWHGKISNKVEPGKKEFGKLLIARHAESEWNSSGKWTGITDVHLSSRGFRQSAALGRALKILDIRIDTAYCSEQIRTRETLESMLNASQQFDVDIIREKSLNERDYGEFTGKNKTEVKNELGDDRFNQIQLGWDELIPEGETLKTVYERAVPFYKETVLPLLKQGKNVLIVAHASSIRALMKYLESVSDDDVSELEMPFEEIATYEIDDEGTSKNKSVVKANGAAIS